MPDGDYEESGRPAQPDSTGSTAAARKTRPSPICEVTAPPPLRRRAMAGHAIPAWIFRRIPGRRRRIPVGLVRSFSDSVEAILVLSRGGIRSARRMPACESSSDDAPVSRLRLAAPIRRRMRAGSAGRELGFYERSSSFSLHRSPIRRLPASRAQLSGRLTQVTVVRRVGIR